MKTLIACILIALSLASCVTYDGDGSFEPEHGTRYHPHSKH